MPEPPPGASKALFKGFRATVGGCQVGVKLFINICASVAFFSLPPSAMGSNTDISRAHSWLIPISCSISRSFWNSGEIG